MTDPNHEHGRNHALWVAPLLALAGLVGYFTVAARYPLLGDTGWLNLLVLAGALALSVVALARAWARGGWLRRGAGIAGTAFSALCAGFLCYYLFALSSDIPDAALAAPEGEALPALTLADHEGEPVALAELGRKQDVLLVFYRGHW